jgi:hypothetical protein
VFAGARRWEVAALGVAVAGMLAMLVVPACTDSGSDGNYSEDARCVAICDGESCADAATRQDCIDTCSIGIHATSATCSACMLDNVCASGCTLEFSAANCSDDCKGTPAVDAGDDDPRCGLICKAENDCTTASQLDTCDAACDAAVAGTSGPCGSCLLDNVCATSCNFRQTDASECNSLCN